MSLFECLKCGFRTRKTDVRDTWPMCSECATPLTIVDEPKPFESLYEHVTKSDKARKHRLVMVRMFVDCLTTPGFTIGYYCSKPIDEVKAKFVKLLSEISMGLDKWNAVEQQDAIVFPNGSKVQFVYAAASDNYYIVAPITAEVDHAIRFHEGGIVKEGSIGKL